MEKEFEVVLIAGQPNIGYVEPCFRKDIASIRAIDADLAQILAEDSDNVDFARALRRKFGMLRGTWHDCVHTKGFRRIHYYSEPLYEMRIMQGDFNVRVLFGFAIIQSREIALLLGAFNEKNAKNGSKDSHKTADPIMVARMQGLMECDAVERFL